MSIVPETHFCPTVNYFTKYGKYEVTLDQRKLKTPKGQNFDVNSKPLALAVATEWDSQEETINRSNMHLTALCSTVLDNPNNHQKVDIINYIVNYLETDTILFHSSEIDDLYKLQTQRWDPLIQWFCDRLQVNIIKTQSIETPIVPPETKNALKRHLTFYNDNAIQGFMYGVDILKSVILTLAAAERAITVQEAVKLSRLEEEYQISHWGTVEWSHDLSKEDMQARLAAAILFIHLNSTSVSHQPKIEFQ
ncbi:ATP synthase mitochondrial F1 complex assembly factor 2 isoform X2 [Orussus abietinus]|uniref:ATP synthase mitochondrial F1 complex assembly factor 2 isoform X2 n=1 Tax=Orussus abietinus TaxID=222816 RepID=UPI000626C1BA|nr:ATP synthase mitochondrial F1 complex assembly factor 2 isoform X2 [Orussus abietinus]